MDVDDVKVSDAVKALSPRIVDEFWEWHFWDYHQQPRHAIDRALLQFDVFCKLCDKMNEAHEEAQSEALPLTDMLFEGPRLQKMSREQAKLRKNTHKKRQRALHLARKRQSRAAT